MNIRFFKALFLVLFLASFANSQGADLSPYEEEIGRASAKYGVSRDLIRAVMKRESGFDPNAVSSAGAQGLMQLMPGTASDMGVGDSFDPEQNIDGGTKYLAEQLARYGGDQVLALAAYNAGPGNVNNYGGVPPFEETVNYITAISGFLDGYGAGALDLSGLPTSYTAPPTGTPGSVDISPVVTASVAEVVNAFESAIGLSTNSIKNGLVVSLYVVFLIWLAWQTMSLFSNWRKKRLNGTEAIFGFIRSNVLVLLFLSFIRFT